MPEQNKFIRGQISWISYRQTFVEYDRAERAGGATGYPYHKMLRLSLDGIIGEYIARLSANVRQRPLYLVSATNLPPDLSPGK